MTVQTGLQRLALDGHKALAGRRLGLLCNPTAVDERFVHAIDLLTGRRELRITALLGPEHGIRGDAQDMIAVDAARDARTGLPVFSLYGHAEASLTPTPEMLDAVDAVVYDIQDVGSRYYTFVWTMVLAMRACARAGKAFVVLDRPNPLGGAAIEGGAISPGYESFVGLTSCPNRHGLTAGEIARWRHEAEGLDLELLVISMRGWRREDHHGDTGLPWVMPSPNMPTPETARVYPGQVLLEGTNLSEGRGTTRPFELFGAPWVQGRELTDALNALRLPGVVFREAWFTPSFSKHRGELCGGAQIHVVDPARFRSVITTLRILETVRRLHPGRLTFQGPTFDRLMGTAAVRPVLESGGDLAPVIARIDSDLKAFEALREPHLLYR